MTELSARMIGLTVRLCGLTGVMTKFPDRGKISGPPQLNEYPVDPVGVATIIPSAQYEFKNSPLMNVWIVIMDDVSFFTTVKSFSAKFSELKISALLSNFRSDLLSTV